MRLTLRTLLAYLDDTLDATETKAIGQKVAESDGAQELIARIKEVTRRRRLTTPSATGPGAKVDPNSIAEYLDNELSAEQLAEVEQLALSSDVHLAEIASCHQILTLILGEPALVPPSAYKRMYRIVKPPESNHARRPPAPRRIEESPRDEAREVDETLRLGLPRLKGTSSTANRLILLGGAAAVFLLLGVAIWQLLPRFGTRETAVGDLKATSRVLAADGAADKKDKANVDDGKSKKAPDAKPSTEPVPKDGADPREKAKEKDPAESKSNEKVEPKVIEPKKDVDEPPAAPNAAVKDLGVFEPPPPPGMAVLLQLTPDKKTGQPHWTRLLRLKDPARVQSNSPLLSLPGYQSILLLDSGAKATLFGTIPEVWPFYVGRESAVVLHPSDSFDVDLTLVRGKVVLANTKDRPLKVRLRFDNPASDAKGEIWDIVLQEKGTEVDFVLYSIFPLGEPFYPDPANKRREGPLTFVIGFVPAGKATFSANLNKPIEWTAVPDGKVLSWNSKSGVVQYEDRKKFPDFLFAAPKADAKLRGQMNNAMDNLSSELTSRAVDTVLAEALKGNDPFKGKLALRCAAAIDDVQRVADVLGNGKDQDLRLEAIEVLHAWLAHSPKNDYILLSKLQPAYSEGDAISIVSLLHRFSVQQIREPQTYELLLGLLENKKTAVKELAHWHLIQLAPQGRQFAFNAAGTPQQNQAAVAQWKKLIPPGSLPPPPAK